MKILILSLLLSFLLSACSRPISAEKISKALTGCESLGGLSSISLAYDGLVSAQCNGGVNITFYTRK